MKALLTSYFRNFVWANNMLESKNHHKALMVPEIKKKLSKRSS